MCTNDICKSWNKASRKVWKLPSTAHTCFLGPLNGQLHILDQIVIRFIRFYNCLVSSDNSIVSFIGRVSMSNRMSYLRSNVLYIKWKYDVDITTTNIQQCIKCVYDTGQENAQILSYVNIIQELIDARDGFKIINNLCKNEIIELIFYISTIDVI